MIALVAALTRVEAAVKDNPYHSIVLRNSFNLRQAIHEPVQETVKLAPWPGIQLTGVTNIAGRQWALLEITEPGQPVKRPVLSDGQSIDRIEVLQIDVAAGRVRLRVLGTEIVVALERVRPAGPAR